MARPSLESISRRYGQHETFGHKDYEAAKQSGYTDSEIKNWLDQDLNRLHPNNRPGGISGLYDEVSSGYVDLNKAVNIDRGVSYVPAETNWAAPSEPEGMTPFEYDYQRAIDIANIQAQAAAKAASEQARGAIGAASAQAAGVRGSAALSKEGAIAVANIQKKSALGVAGIQKESALAVANIDKQIKQMQLESAENLQKLSDNNKRTLANISNNQSILTGLVNAFNF